MVRRLDTLSPEEQEIERAKGRAYYRANREKMLAQSKAAQKIRYAANKQLFAERAKARRATRPPLTEAQREIIRARERARYRRHRERILAWRRANRERIRVQQRAGYERNREKTLAKQRERYWKRKLEKASDS